MCNKPSLLEGLEIDQVSPNSIPDIKVPTLISLPPFQFSWSILQTPRFADVDEVAVDQQANVSAMSASAAKVSGDGEIS